MPLLRLQQPCAARADRRGALRAGVRGRDRRDRGARARTARVSSIFFGGGTPSLMQPATVAAVLDAIARHWRVAPDAEMTLEANPTSVEATRFRGYRAAGVNRVSLGVQALDDRVLAELGRMHTAREALDAVAVARTVFDRYSFDLIYARPGQAPEAWADELKTALAEAGEHLSLYQLTIEPETPFAALHAAGNCSLPDEDTARALYDMTQEICARARAAGLRDFQSCAAGRRVPAQPRLLARARICRHRPRRPWPARYRRPKGAPRHRDRKAAGNLARCGSKPRPRPRHRRGADPRGKGGRVPADGAAARRGHRSRALRGDLRPPARSGADRTLREHGLVETTADGRLRVTLPDFPVLDAVVADLAA